MKEVTSLPLLRGIRYVLNASNVLGRKRGREQRGALCLPAAIRREKKR